MRLLFIQILFFLSFSHLACAQNEKITVVYVVRHAEKADNPADKDPELSAAGVVRAEALATYLKDVHINTLFSSPYRRNNLTVQPLAKAKNLKITTYEPHDFRGLAATIKDYHPGENIVVSAHSNTVLEIVEALGVERPVERLSDVDYNYIFKVVLREGQTPEVIVDRFGGPNPSK